MRGMSSPFDFEVLVKNDCCVTDYFSGKRCLLNVNSFCEPISVLDSRIPSGPTSSSTLSSSLGGDGGGAASTDTVGVAPSSKWQQDSTTATSSIAGGIDSELLPVPPSLSGGVRAEKCAMESWESVLSESAASSPGQEQSVFRYIMGDVEDLANNGCLNKFLQFGGGGIVSNAAEFGFSGGFGVMDQMFSVEDLGNRFSYEKIDSLNPVKLNQNSQNLMYNSSAADNSLGAISFDHEAAFDSSIEFKHPIVHQQLLIGQNQAHSFILPFTFAKEQEHTAPAPHPVKRIDSGMFVDLQQQLHLLPYYNPEMSGGDELQQQAIIDCLYNAAELLQTGNLPLAQGILARLNHQLSPIGRPFQRAAFYCKEALKLLLHPITTTTTSMADSSPLHLMFKIGAHKSFSEVSPLVDFANLTCNQALLEVLEGFDRIHIVDFDIGYGGQWASLLKELALRSGGAPVVRITALVSPATHNQLELSLTRDNLIQFANEMNIGFEFNFMSIDSLRSGSLSLPHHLTDQNEAVTVNLPIGCLTNHQLSAPLALRIVKQLSPKAVFSMARGCDRADLPFPNHIIHAVLWYASLLESLDAANVNVEALQKIERLSVQPGMEALVMSRFRAPEKWQQHWRSLFVSCGLSPVGFSSLTESQAECVARRSPVGGFTVETRQSSLVVCWQRRELLSASLWRCSTL